MHLTTPTFDVDLARFTGLELVLPIQVYMRRKSRRGDSEEEARVKAETERKKWRAGTALRTRRRWTHHAEGARS